MDETRRRILARRAAFVAVAAAGLSGGSCEPKPGADPHVCLSMQPQVCLSQPMPQDTGVEETDDGTPDAAAVPQPCLEIAVPEDASAGQPQKADTGKVDTGKVDTGPKACLNVM